MSTKLPYLKEKFDQALTALATGEGDARSRIEVAYHFFWIIPVEDFPKHLQEPRQQITHLLTRLGGKEGYVIPENLQRMKNSTASEVAQLILDIYRRLQEPTTK